MPLYEYQCSGCGRVHEIIQKFADAPMEICPDCGQPVSKLMSRTHFALKGTGWYTTDYKKSAAPTITPPSAPAEAQSPSTPAAPTTSAAPTPSASPGPASAPASTSASGASASSEKS